MSTPALQASGTPTAGQLLRSFPSWMKKNIGSTLIAAISGGVMGYISNVWLMAFKYEGSGVPAGAATPGQGNAVSGGLFWAIASSVVFGIAGYWKSVGTKKFIEDLKGLPGVIASLFKRDGKAGQVHLLWGAATALLASVVISPAIGGILAVGILLAAPSVFGNIISTLVFRIWSSVIKLIAPTRKHKTTGILSMTVGLIGAAAALAVTFLVTGVIVKLILAALCAVTALLLSRQRPPSSVMLVMLILIGMILAQLFSGGIALADDGGWIECGVIDDTIAEHFERWLTNCPGTAAVLILALLGAGPAALFAPFGWFLGNLAGGWGRFGGPGPDRPLHHPPPPDDYEKRRRQAIAGWIRGLIDDPAFQQWRALHPEYGPGEPSNAEFEAYMRWRHEQGLEDPPLILPQEPVFEGYEGLEPSEEPPDEDWPSVDELIDSLFGPDPFGENFEGAEMPAGGNGAGGGMPTVDEVNDRIDALRGKNFDPTSPEGKAFENLLGKIRASEGGFTPQMATELRNIENLSKAGIGNRIDEMWRWNPNVPLPPDVWNAMDNLQKQINQSNGAFTPEMLATLQGIEAAQGRTSNNHLTEITQRLGEHADQGMKFIDDQNKNALAMEEAQRNMAREIEAREAYIWKKMDDLPIKEWKEYHARLMQNATSPNPEALNRLRKMSDTLFKNQQAGFGIEKGEATKDAEWYKNAEEWAKTVQKSAIAGSLLLAPFAIPLTAVGAANLGAFTLGTSAVTGFGVGYTTGGMKGALVETARYTLPINTLEASFKALGNALHPDDPRYKGYGVGDIGLGLVSDLGNVLGLKGGLNGIKNMGRVPPDLPVDTSAIRKLSDPTPTKIAKTAEDAQALARTANANRLRNEFSELGEEARKFEQLGDATNAAAARARQAEKALEISSNPTAKNQLKNLPLEQQQEVMKHLNPISVKAIDGMVDGANQSGLTRGGRQLTNDDVFQLRNKKSIERGDLGMDADVAINQKAQRALQDELEAALKKDPNSGAVTRLREDLKKANAADAFELNGKKISPSEANKILQQEYDKAYRSATATPLNPKGQSADQAWHMVTEKGHVEAYRDMNVLKNNPADHKFAKEWAEQTGSVTSHKKDALLEKVHSGELSKGEAMTEIARGTAKDIKGKLEPLLEHTGADPKSYQRIREMHDFLEEAGKGKYLPSEMDAIAKSKFGATVDQLADQVDSNITAAVKQSGYGPSPYSPGGFKQLSGPGVEALESTGKSILKAELKGAKTILKEELHPSADAETRPPSQPAPAARPAAAPSRPATVSYPASPSTTPGVAAVSPAASSGEVASAAPAGPPSGRGTSTSPTPSELRPAASAVSGPPRAADSQVTGPPSRAAGPTGAERVAPAARAEPVPVSEQQGFTSDRGGVPDGESRGIRDSSEGALDSQRFKESQGEMKQSQGFKESRDEMKQSEGEMKQSEGEMKQSEAFKESEGFAKSSEVSKTSEGFAKSAEISKTSEGFAKSAEVSKTSEGFAKSAEISKTSEGIVKEVQGFKTSQDMMKSSQGISKSQEQAGFGEMYEGEVREGQKVYEPVDEPAPRRSWFRRKGG